MKATTLLTLIFISALSQAQTFSWVRQLGGTLNEGVSEMVTDPAGNIYTIGDFEGTMDADPGPGSFMLVSAGMRDIFISKIDGAGNFVWAKQISGTYSEQGLGIARAVSGNIYIVGSFRGTVDFNPNAGEYLMTSLTSYYEDYPPCSVLADAFILKLDASGSFIWARQLGGNGTDKASALALDGSENVYVVGEYTTYQNEPLDLDPTGGEFIVSSPNWAGAFMLKLDTDGGFGWAHNWESTHVSASGCSLRDGWVNPASITIDGLGNVVAAGHFGGTVDFDPGEGIYTVGGANNAFVLKLTNGGEFIWMRSPTNPENNAHAWGRDVVTDAADNVIVVGTFDGTFDFDPGSTTKTLKAPGGFGGPIPITPREAFIWKLTSSGNYFWAGQMGGNTDDAANSVDVDANGNIYITGEFTGTADFNPSSAKNTLKSAGGTDIFISKLTASGGYVSALRMGSTTGEYVSTLDIDAAGAILTTGTFQGTVDFNPSSGTFNLTSLGGYDVFLHKMSQAGGGNLARPWPDEIEVMEANVFPNPTAQVLNIDFARQAEDVHVMVYDLRGQLMLQKNHVSGMRVSVDVSVLPVGMYMVRFGDAVKPTVLLFSKIE